ncbi:MAG: LUD domain-containing protein [Bacteroidales bacterium]|nr:LUD domain-containing protein [Bacteroidales bacterium]
MAEINSKPQYEDSIAKEKIINELKHVTANKNNASFSNTDTDGNVIADSKEYLEDMFSRKFVQNGGKLIFCETDQEMLSNIQAAVKEFNWIDIYCYNNSIGNILSTAEIKFKNNIGDLPSVPVGMTKCDALIANQGSIVISNESDKKRKLSAIAHTHVVFATIDQIVPDFKAAIEKMKKPNNRLPDTIEIISGPSSTTVAECNPIIGAQGPKELYLFLLA